ncbi:MAG: MFS transporter [Bacteroidota bacterium]|nr:MFS transporter [Bacteroidota bacterium]
MTRNKIITKTVLYLSLVSLFTDISSELLYPVMPLYLKSIGFSVFLIGILEGIAEATAGLSKGYFGILSDKWNKRVPFVRAGYTLSAISKPMMVIMTFPLWIFLARTLDRFGKGIRTGARDALLSDESTPENKGKVFGFHRGMDTMGAFIGPVLALIYLHFYPGKYYNMFLIAFIPGIISVLLTYLIKENPRHHTINNNIKKKTSFFDSFSYWKNSSTEYKRILIGFLVFAFFNSSDMFLLLKVKQCGFSELHVIGVYIFYNFMYAVFSYPIGYIGDKIGLKSTFIFGLTVFTIVYACISVSINIYILYSLFALYGLYTASTEGISKAWISNVCKKSETATAIGTYAGFNSIMLMISSSFAGFIWYKFGPASTFIVSACGCFLVIIYFSLIRKYTKS